MTQTFQPPVSPGTDDMAQAVSVKIPAALESLRSSFSGATEPTPPNSSAVVPGQLWADTSTGLLKIRNAANNAWLPIAPLSAAMVMQLAAEGWAGSHSATKTDLLAVCPRAGTVSKLRMVSGAATTSSSGNEWQFALKKYPASAPGSPVQLFSGTVGTFTSLGGVGGGAEFAANKAYDLTPNQNATVADGDVLELTITEVGTIAALTTFRPSVLVTL